MNTDDLGDRMKLYEMAEAGRCFMPKLPICIRLDGRAFSSWTRGLEQPYDTRLRDLMVAVNPDLTVERHDVAQLNIPPLNQVKNRVEVLLFGAEPVKSE
jgi:hypothetical protein